MVARLFVCGAFVLVLIHPTRAFASPIFPGIVASVVGAAQSPPCTVCHATPSGGLGTATKPLAVYLRSRGLVAEDEASLRAALAAAAGEAHDTDGDGITDTKELAAGTDPNGASSDLPPVEYGCGNVAGARPSSTPIAAIVAALLARVCRARRQRQRLIARYE